ncbi:glycosyltransferase [uncultured Arthrobacter sp.]|uniref:glycosyltransferase n=1 Tax=uncultured Arthrobacter sp. TaxID=114050 RepID=UPI00321715B9
MPAKHIDLSIIIPAYKEGPEFSHHLDVLAAWLKKHDYGHVEVLVFSDGDHSSGELAQSKAKQFENLRAIFPGQRMGKGGAVQQAMFEAKGRYRLFMDADLATPLHHLDTAYAALRSGNEVVIAVRDLLIIHKGLKRKFMSKFGNIVAQIVLLPGIKDTQCGFKGFEATAAEDIFSRQTMKSWSFDMEILKIARLRGYKIYQIPALDWKDPKAEGMGLVGDNPLKAAIQTFIDIFVIRLNVWLGKYRRQNYKHE